MGFVAGRNLKGRGLDLEEAGAREPGPQGARNPAARHQIRPARAMNAGQPERHRFGHVYLTLR